MNITVDDRASFRIISLSRSEKMNALSPEMMSDLNAAFHSVNLNQHLRAVILTANGSHAFCAGTDIAQLAGKDDETASVLSQRGQELCEQIESCRVPVIAAINGIAAGGGLELALACHIRLGSTSAKFSLPETKLGVIPAYGGTQRLPRIIGTGRALELMLTGKTISADEAFEVGLLNKVTSPESLLEEAESLVQEIAKQAPLAIRACLTAVLQGMSLPLNEGLKLEAELFSKLFATRDVKEGTSAFLEKRSPEFVGE